MWAPPKESLKGGICTPEPQESERSEMRNQIGQISSLMDSKRCYYGLFTNQRSRKACKETKTQMKGQNSQPPECLGISPRVCKSLTLLDPRTLQQETRERRRRERWWDDYNKINAHKYVRARPASATTCNFKATNEVTSSPLGLPPEQFHLRSIKYKNSPQRRQDMVSCSRHLWHAKTVISMWSLHNDSFFINTTF